MAKLNNKKNFTILTHEGAPAKRITPEQELRRSVMCCMLWEDTFYEDGVSIAERIKNLVSQVKPENVANMAIEVREKMKLRHAPLWIVNAMAPLSSHKHLVADTLARVIQRPDELTEFLALYWKNKRVPISKQIKKGLAKAFLKFDAYQLAKYNRNNNIKLRDVLFLCHAKPQNSEQESVWKQLIDGTLPSPDTWEVALSTGKNKKETWERLLSENKLGALALIRNLRNMYKVNVDKNLIINALDNMKTERILPFRFISAAKYAPQLEDKLEEIMFKCIANKDKLPGKTILLIDVSGSMESGISNNSELVRWEAAASLAILAQQICEEVSVYLFNCDLHALPSRKGFALRDAIAQEVGGGTELGYAVKQINKCEKYDRLIVITDEQSHDVVPNPKGKGYIVNVAPYKNGIGYGKWIHIDGWSEAILDYIQEYEKNL